MGRRVVNRSPTTPCPNPLGGDDNGATLALGGLIQQRTDNTRTKVSILGDLPVLGSLFRSSDDTQARTELLILIRPSLVRNLQEARDVTAEFRQRVQQPRTPEPGGRMPGHAFRPMFW